MTPTFTICAACPRCGGEFRRVNACRPSDTLLTGVVACDACRKQWTMAVRLEPLELARGEAQQWWRAS